MMRVSRKRTFLVTCSWGAAVYICQLRDCSYPPLHPPPLHLSLVSLVCGHAMRRVALTLLPVASILLHITPPYYTLPHTSQA